MTYSGLPLGCRHRDESRLFERPTCHQRRRLKGNALRKSEAKASRGQVMSQKHFSCARLYF